MPGIDSYTKLCIVSDGITDGNTTFNDLSNSGHTVVAHGDINHSTDDPFFGFTAIKSDGDGDFLAVAHEYDAEDPETWESNTDFDFATGDYTLEKVLRTTTLSGGFFSIDYYHSAIARSEIRFGIGNHSQGGDTWGIAYFSHYYYLNGSVSGYRTAYSTANITDGERHHIELVRSGGVYTLRVDGSDDNSTSSTSGTVVSLTGNNGVIIGSLSFSSMFFSGDYDQIRISNGIARHTSDFTPSDESFDDLIVGLSECTPPLVSLDATGTFPTFGFGEFNTPAPWLSSVGYNPILGYVEFNAPLPVITAAEMSLGYGEIDTPAVTLTSTGSNQIFGWTEFNTKRVALDSSGTSQVFGFGNINTKLVSLFAESGGDVRMYSKSVSLDSTGVMAYPGFGNINTPRAGLSSYGMQSLTATVNMTPLLPKLISRSTGSSGYEVVKYRR